MIRTDSCLIYNSIKNFIEDFLFSKLGIKSGSEHVGHFLDSQIRIQKLGRNLGRKLVSL